MSNVGDKIKGTFNTIHGIGENIRATTLGAVDTIAHDKEGETKNDQIAQQGRIETQRGLEQMSGRPRDVDTVPTTYQRTTAAMGNSTSANTTANISSSGYPRHHRDDEVYNDSQAQAVYDRNTGVPSQAGYNSAGTAPQSLGNGYEAGTGAGYNDTANSQYDSGHPQYSTGNPQYDNGRY